jgi:DNA-directed RNA polymerase subunit RPC12/RpoP
MTYSPQLKVSFQCPNCRKQFTAPSTVAGRQVRCSGCGSSVTVPGPGSSPQAAARLRPPVVAPSTNASPRASLPTNPQRSSPPATPPPHAHPSTRPHGWSFSTLGTAGLVALGILFVGGIATAFRQGSPRNAAPSRPPSRSFWNSTKTKTVQLKVGTATITDDVTGTSHVRVSCNNGLVIDADWKRNPYTDFGYDIYEPTVNRSYNRLAVMVTARGVIAAYLRGEYD